MTEPLPPAPIKNIKYFINPEMETVNILVEENGITSEINISAILGDIGETNKKIQLLVYPEDLTDTPSEDTLL